MNNRVRNLILSHRHLALYNYATAFEFHVALAKMCFIKKVNTVFYLALSPINPLQFSSFFRAKVSFSECLSSKLQ